MTIPNLEPNLDWHSPAKRYLERLGLAEYRAWKATKPRKRDRFAPSEYHRALIDCLNRNDEAGFKTLKLETGYASVIGV
jgi:hypothetical protein